MQYVIHGKLRDSWNSLSWYHVKPFANVKLWSPVEAYTVNNHIRYTEKVGANLWK
jgi:hypothetical protein